MAILVDAVERSQAEWSRDARDIGTERRHYESAIAQDKYLPVLFGSLTSPFGNYSIQPTSKDLLKQQQGAGGGNASFGKEKHTQLEPRTTVATENGLLTSNSRIRNNSCSENIDIATINNKCTKGRNHQARPHGLEQQQERQFNQLIKLLIVTLICLHNAPSCASFSVPDNDNNTGLSRNDNYRQNHLINEPSISLPWQWPNRIKRGLNQYSTRSFYDTINQMNPLGDLSTIFGSFSQDGPSSGPPGNGAQQSWTSIFGGGGSPSGSNGGGGGGDALDVHVKNILVPRVSGTPGNIKVRQYIIDVMRKNDYQVELDEFTGSTPIGNVKFANIIASSNPGACRQLVLACHYDSKLQDGFLGATDSAVPCAMLLKIAETHNKSYRNDDSGDLGLRFIFFDGEEAFVQWTATDSLYGSRHLAAKWAKQQAPAQCQGKAKSELERIELFVLLDLIGASDTTFVMYNTQLRHHYESLQKHERSFLVRGGLNQVQARRQAAFKGRTMPLDFVEDDHVPFKKRGVPILLLLAHPFPRVWHTNADNYESIDWHKTRRILHVMEEFVSSYPNNKNI